MSKKRGHSVHMVEHTVGFDQWTECIEEPPVTVELLLVLLLQAEDDLDGTGTHRDLACVGDHDAAGISRGCGMKIFAGRNGNDVRTRRCVL